MLLTALFVAQILVGGPPADPPVIRNTPVALPPVMPPAATNGPVQMVDATTLADGPIRTTFAERLGLPDSTVVWHWVRDGMLPMPAGAAVRVLTVSRDGKATVQFSMGGSSLGLGQAKVGQVTSLPRAARPIRSGTVLDSADRVFATDTVWGDPRYPPVLDVVGWMAMAPLPEGSVLVPPRVRPKAAVVAGRPVNILWDREGITVRRTGVALTNGIMGERVRVRIGEVNQGSKVIEARVTGTALVEAL